MGPISAEQAAAAETARKNAVTAAATAVVSTKVRALESSLITAKKNLLMTSIHGLWKQCQIPTNITMGK